MRRQPTCRECGKPVVRARTEALKWQLLNPRPDPAGNVHARQDHNRNWFARSVKPGTPATWPEVLMMPHAATCEKRDTSLTSGSKTGTPPGVASLDAWRKALAARGRAARNRRGRRQADITGVRIDPGRQR